MMNGGPSFGAFHRASRRDAAPRLSTIESQSRDAVSREGLPARCSSSWTTLEADENVDDLQIWKISGVRYAARLEPDSPFSALVNKQIDTIYSAIFVTRVHAARDNRRAT